MLSFGMRVSALDESWLHLARLRDSRPKSKLFAVGTPEIRADCQYLWPLVAQDDYFQ